MTVEISKNPANEYEINYSIKSGKKISRRLVGKILCVDGYFLLMDNNVPIKVMKKITEMDSVIQLAYKVKPSYVNILF